MWPQALGASGRGDGEGLVRVDGVCSGRRVGAIPQILGVSGGPGSSGEGAETLPEEGREPGPGWAVLTRPLHH